MIRVFSATDKIYNSNGDVIIQPIKTRVFNSDNGDFYLTLTCGVEYTDYMQANNIIVAPTPQGAQAFRIKTVTKSKKKIEVKAWHVYYDSDNYIIADSYAVNMTCAQALAYFNNNTDVTSPFATGSNITTRDSFRCVRKSLKEAIETILERWGGHLKRDNFNIKILSAIGNDNGVTIEYKKNLQDLTAEYDFSNVCTKVLPVGKDGALLPSLYVSSSTQYDVPYTKVVNFSQNIDAADYETQAEYEQAIQADLLEQATEYLTNNCMPVINYTLKGKPEKVADIGDYIRVKDKRIGVDVLTQVISYDYDAIRETYASLEFGNFTTNLKDLISVINNDTTETVASTVKDAVAGKQDTLTAGDNINLVNNIISAENTTYTNFVGATASDNGKSGLVPAPSIADRDKYLQGGGTWAEIPTYTAGNGISISSEEISLTPTTIASNLYTTAAYKRNDVLYFNITLPAPDYNQDLSIKNLYLEIYDSYATNSYSTSTIVTNGTNQGDYNAYINYTDKTLMQIAISDTSGIISTLTDGAYIINADITLIT